MFDAARFFNLRNGGRTINVPPPRRAVASTAALLITSGIAACTGGLLGCSLPPKDLLLIRHGQTEMNAYFQQRLPSSVFGQQGFKDPGLWDTRLTAKGEAQAKGIKVPCEPELVVASPLRRALRTADLAFGRHLPRAVCADVRERLYLSSDAGSSPSDLAAEFELWDFSGLGEEWWYTDASWREGEDPRPAGEYLTPCEPEDVFLSRLRRFKRWLGAREERRIAVVCHAGVLLSLTGLQFANCELRGAALADLPAELTKQPKAWR